MPIHFEIDDSGKYFTSKYSGKMSGEELLREYREFVENGPFRPGMHELVDACEAEMTQVTADHLKTLAEYFIVFLERARVSEMATAVYSTRDLPFGLARMYQAFSEESPESVRVFRDLAEARAWLLDR